MDSPGKRQKPEAVDFLDQGLAEGLRTVRRSRRIQEKVKGKVATLEQQKRELQRIQRELERDNQRDQETISALNQEIVRLQEAQESRQVDVAQVEVYREQVDVWLQESLAELRGLNNELLIISGGLLDLLEDGEKQEIFQDEYRQLYQALDSDQRDDWLDPDSGEFEEQSWIELKGLVESLSRSTLDSPDSRPGPQGVARKRRVIGDDDNDA